MSEVSNSINNSILQERRKRTRVRIVRYAFFTFLTIVFAGFLGIYTAINFGKLSLMDTFITLMPQVGLDDQANILVIGVDDTLDSRRSDTIMLVHLDTRKNRAGVLSIPRDSRIEVPGVGSTKINHAYAHGGTSLLIQTVEEFLQIPIDYYVLINLKGVINIIDQIGGVTIDVDKRMYYVDKAGDLFIDLQPGTHNLSGKEAMGYIRYRHDINGDITRITRQQNFMKAVAEKIIQSGKVFQTPKLFAELTHSFDTNMSTKQLLSLALKIRSIMLANRIDVETVPGGVILLEGVSYWRPDLPSTLKVIDRVVHGFDNVSDQPVQYASATKSVEDSAESGGRSKTKETPRVNAGRAEKSDLTGGKELGEPKQLTAREIKKLAPGIQEVTGNNVLPPNMALSIEVLNGCGVPLIAQEVARDLKGKGIKVPWVGNAAHFNYENTIIVDWKGLTREVLQLASSLQVSPKNIVTYYKPNKKLDVTLVIGKDWQKIKNNI